MQILHRCSVPTKKDMPEAIFSISTTWYCPECHQRWFVSYIGNSMEAKRSNSQPRFRHLLWRRRMAKKFEV